MPQPVAIFNCAASQDVHLLAEWETHILPLQQAGLITLWSDTHLLAGQARHELMVQHLETADIIVLLLSADFFAESACCEIMEKALQRSRSGQATVVPLLLRPVAWRDTPLAHLSCLPTNGSPITKWSDHDEAFQDCVNGVKQLLTQPAVIAQGSHPATVSSGPSSSARYCSCFLAYAHQDQPLAQRLHDDLEARGVACWFALRDMKIGARIRPALDQAIHQQEKLLLLLSQHSINSAWIEDEVEAALEYERNEGREILFPVGLDKSFEQTTRSWAAKIRRTRHIGDFTNWTEPQAYQQAFVRLLRDLETEHTTPIPIPETLSFLPELEEIDNTVMKLLCEEAIVGDNYWVYVEQPIIQAETLDIQQDQFLEVVRVLQQQGFLDITEAMGGDISLLKLKTHAFERYAQVYVPQYQQLKVTLVLHMLQNDIRFNGDFASQLHQPIMLCNHILNHLALHSFIEITETMGNNIRIWDISAELNRAFKSGTIESFFKKKGI